MFNARLGQREGQEHEKILFYHTPGTDAALTGAPLIVTGKLPDISIQTKNVGLCEALINFTKFVAIARIAPA